MWLILIISNSSKKIVLKNFGKNIEKLDKYLVLKREFEWESRKIGSGPPPIKTREGWLLIYHGVDRDGIYRVGASLLELEDPRKVLAKLPVPILELEKDYEKWRYTQCDIPYRGCCQKRKALYLLRCRR